jgi:glycosyltransferase involved in cell wall biosynthesis
MTLNQNARPFVSIIVIIHNMLREAPRTIYSLSSCYQNGVTADDYEVIVVENGSTEPLSADQVTCFGPNFKYFYFDTKSPSPAQAVNFGVRQSSGQYAGIMVDGARILTPGVLKYAIHAARCYQNPVISTPGWHLGPDVQTRSIKNGYSPEVEDALLAKSNWTRDGYKLFEISSFAGSSINGFFMPIAESNCFFIKRKTFDALGGFEERFNAPGGGLVNLDIYKRACELSDAHLVIILGEGSFHQVHGGITTNVTEEKSCSLWHDFEKQYIEIRGHGYSKPVNHPEYVGHLQLESLRFFQYSAEKAHTKQRPFRRLKNALRRLFD